MLKFTDVIITTKRLVLKPISHYYRDVIFEEFTPVITKYMTPVPSANEDEVSSFIDFSIAKLKDNSNLQLVILKADHNEFIGCAGLHKNNY